MKVQIRWADLDPNFHVRHSVYYDWGATARTQLLIQAGLTPQVMAKLHFGPILFREECTFRREIHFGDDIEIDTVLVESRPDYSRWTMRHRIMRGEEVCATLIIEGAWLDTKIRKLTAPPEVGAAALALLPHVNGEE